MFFFLFSNTVVVMSHSVKHVGGALCVDVLGWVSSHCSESASQKQVRTYLLLLSVCVVPPTADGGSALRFVQMWLVSHTQILFPDITN